MAQKYTKQNLEALSGQEYSCSRTRNNFYIDYDGTVSYMDDEEPVFATLAEAFHYAEEVNHLPYNSLRARMLVNELTGTTLAQDFEDPQFTEEPPVEVSEDIPEPVSEDIPEPVNPKEYAWKVITDMLTGKRSLKQVVMDTIDLEEKLGILDGPLCTIFRKLAEAE